AGSTAGSALRTRDADARSAAFRSTASGNFSAARGAAVRTGSAFRFRAGTGPARERGATEWGSAGRRAPLARRAAQVGIEPRIDFDVGQQAALNQHEPNDARSPPEGAPHLRTSPGGGPRQGPPSARRRALLPSAWRS